VKNRVPAQTVALARALIRLGSLTFDDFLLLDAGTARAALDRPAMRTLLPVALVDRPHLLGHFMRSSPGQSGWLADAVIAARGGAPASPDEARRALTESFACELLREKSPPLYETLPWHDWDFGEVARRFPPWRTRFLLAGDSSSVTMAHCRRTAGVFIVEPLASIRDYLARKAALLGLRRFELIAGGAQAIPLPDRSVELAIATADPGLVTDASLAELGRVAQSSLVVCARPGSGLDARLARRHSLTPGSLSVAPAGGTVRCWWAATAPRP